MNDSTHQKLNLFEPDSIELESKSFQRSPRESPSALGITRNQSGIGTPIGSFK